MKTWFIADTHFGHGGALGLFKRPFSSTAEMDEGLIANWNEVVAPQDTVWHLGDFGYRLRAARVDALLAQLHGRKRLIVGNNDGPETVGATGWESVAPYAEITIDDVPLVLCHYPFRSWNGMRKGSWNLHGHCHGALTPAPRQADVGVEIWNYRPVAFAPVRDERQRRRATRTEAGA